MAYIDYDYYLNNFGGNLIPFDEFDFIADAATLIIDGIVSKEITEASERVKRATAYQADTIFVQGGVNAINGLPSGRNGISETLGDYSVSVGAGSGANFKTYGGIPVSQLSVTLLRQEGLMQRC